MARITDKERVAQWDKRAAASGKHHEEWSTLFSCDLLEDYYYGKQWDDEDSEWAKRRYVINLFYPSINISKPSLLFNIPTYRIKPRPTRIDDPLSDVEARAKLQEDTLNTFVSSPELGFKTETGLAILDAQFRFGVVQVGYTADFIDNPNAGKPVLKENTNEPMKDSSGADVAQPDVQIRSEGLFLKWIPAKQWRVSAHAPNRLSSCDWCGYYEWHYVEDIQRNPRYKNTSGLKAGGALRNQQDEAQTTGEEKAKAGMVKVWFIWDIRARKRMVFAQGGEKFFLEKQFSVLPFAALKFDERLNEWLPLPPSYNWVHPQNELNETRQMQRVHRKRAVRRYLRRNGAFDTEEEFQKLQSDEDMVAVTVNGDPNTACVPMQDAPLDAAIARNIPQSFDDFTRISGISGEDQQVAQSETATQANLIALQGRVRENARRVVVAEWLANVGRIMLLTLREHMALPFWIKVAIDPDSPLAVEEALEVAHLWRQIQARDLQDIDYDVTVDITSMSPVAQEQERTNWLTFLGLVTNPQLGMVLGSSPALLRKTAGLFDIHNERDLVEVSKAMNMMAMVAAQAQAEKAGVQGAPGPGPTPINAETQDQIARQLPAELLQ